MPKRKVRIRVKRLDQLDESKLALAIWLLARDIAEDKTTPTSDSNENGHTVEQDREQA